MSSDAFTDAVFNYDAISKLDPWRTRCGPEAGGEGDAPSVCARTSLEAPPPRPLLTLPHPSRLFPSFTAPRFPAACC